MRAGSSQLSPRPTSQTRPPITPEAKCEPLRYRGPDWMPITPNTGSLFHAETQPRRQANHKQAYLCGSLPECVDEEKSIGSICDGAQNGLTGHKSSVFCMKGLAGR